MSAEINRSQPPPASDRTAMAALGRGALFCVAWVALVGGDPGSWPFGLAAVIATVGLSLWLKPPAAMRLRLAGLIRFVPHFLMRSVMGGIDVARRALDPRLPIAPRMVGYRMRLPEGDPRVVLADVISLLPGTLATGMSGARLRVHALSVDQPLAGQLAGEERQIAGLFGPAAAVSGRVKDCGDG